MQGRPIGSAGVLISASMPGAPCAKTTAQMGTPGTIFRTIMPVRGRIAGTKTAWGGFCDEKQHVCVTVALWNEKDPILKERMFGLTNLEGNHGEDVKEYYFFLDGTPTHSYMKMLYKYPVGAE